MTAERRVRLEVHPGLDDRLAGRLGPQAVLDRPEDLCIGELKPRYVRAVDQRQVDLLRCHAFDILASGAEPCALERRHGGVLLRARRCPDPACCCRIGAI